MEDPNMQILLSATASLFVILVTARLCGKLAARVGQPTVVGEMVAGVLLGPSVLGTFAPNFSAAVFSDESRPTLYVIAFVGLTIYMFLVGLNHDHDPQSRTEAALPVVLGAAGFITPLVLGGAVAWALAGEFKPEAVSTPVFALFVGGALSVTAFPMLARVLQERKMEHTRFGGLATRTAAIDDALAWCVLALVSALVLSGSWWGVARTVLPAAALVVAALVFVPRLLRPLLRQAVEQRSISDDCFVVVLALVMAVGWYTDYIGIYSVFGGFILGLAMPRVRGVQ